MYAAQKDVTSDSTANSRGCAVPRTHIRTHTSDTRGRSAMDTHTDTNSRHMEWGCSHNRMFQMLAQKMTESYLTGQWRTDESARHCGSMRHSVGAESRVLGNYRRQHEPQQERSRTGANQLRRDVHNTLQPCVPGSVTARNMLCSQCASLHLCSLRLGCQRIEDGRHGADCRLCAC